MEDIQNIHYFIAADVGGTNARFRVVKRSTSDPTYRDVVFESIYPVKDYDSIDSIIMTVMGSLNAKIKCITLAAAGNKEGNTVKVTNVPSWPVIDAEEIKKKFKFEEFYLLNDFEANGYGAVAINAHESEDFLVLNEGEPVEQAPKIITGPGTGLGAALIVYNALEGNYNVLRGEGGHTEFTVTNDLELRLRKYAINYFKEKEGIELTRVSTERVTAGPAIPLLYEFLKTEFPDLDVVCQPTEETKEVNSSDVVNAAINDKDPLSLKVVEQFLNQLAVFVGDLIITTLASGGVYLSGGVVEALGEYLKSPECNFLETLKNKGRMSGFVSKVPIYLFRKTPGLDGAEQFGYQSFSLKKSQS